MPDYAALARQYGAVPTNEAVDYDALAKQHGAVSAAVPEKPVGKRVEGNSFSEKLANAAKVVGAVLPAAGGIVGGATFGVPGAAIGGAVGQGYKQLLQHGGEIPGAIRDVASNFLSHPIATAEGAVKGTNTGGIDVGFEAAAQAAGQKTGDALVAGAGVMSKWLMNRATSRVSAKLMQDFPDLNETLLDNALTVSKGGYDKAYALLMDAKAKANAAVKAADASNAKIPVEMTADLAESLKTALLEKAIKSGKVPVTPNQPLAVATQRLDPATKTLFAQIESAAEQGKPFDLAPSHADLLKTQLQKESKALYANRTAPNGPKAIGMDAAERADYATQLNTAIDQIASGYKAANAEARPLIGAVRGIKQATRPSGNLYQAMVRPAVGAALGGAAGGQQGGTAGSVLGGIAGAVATSPAGMSREAILLAHPAMQGALRALPKPLASYLAELLATQSEGSR